MKPRQFFIFFFICGAPLCFAQQSATQLMAEAQRAYYAGNLELAKQKFALVLQVDPQNPTAMRFLTTIRAQESASGAAAAQYEKPFKTLIIPTIQMQEVSVPDALAHLKKLAEKQSEGKLAANFVTKLPPETMEQKISLSLANVPFTEALRYVGELADVQFTFEKYAIVVKKRATATVEQAQQQPARNQ